MMIENFKSDINLELKRNVAAHKQKQLQYKDVHVYSKLNSYQGNREHYSERIRE